MGRDGERDRTCENGADLIGDDRNSERIAGERCHVTEVCKKRTHGDGRTMMLVLWDGEMLGDVRGMLWRRM